MSKNSEVWKYFEKRSTNEAVCKSCPKILGCKGSTTSALINHLKTHNIYINKSGSDTTNFDNGENKKPKYENNMLNYIEKESLEEILSKVAAVDGMSIKAICRSEAIIGYVKFKGYKMPKSPSTVSKHINSFFETKRGELRALFTNLKQTNRKFSITVDEWTDCGLTRYLNVTAHVLGTDSTTFDYHVLGLSEIEGKGNAEKIQLLVETKLAEFGINIKSDVIASTHDGASVMKKYGANLDAINQLCHNHALHLAVISCFYKKQPDRNQCEAAEDNDPGSFIDEDIEEEEPDEEAAERNLFSNIDLDFDDNNETELVLPMGMDDNDNFEEIIKKIRTIIRMFKTSPAKHSILQRNVLQQFGKKIKLKLDIKTRWNSLSIMLKRFLKLAVSVNKSLNDFNMETVSESEILILQNLLDVLLPVETAVLELSKNSATLITAEGVYQFLFNKLYEMESDISKTLLVELKKRMNERRDEILLTLIIYLQTGNIPRSNEYFRYSTKCAAISLAEKIMEKIHPQLFNDANNNSFSLSEESNSDILLESGTPPTATFRLQQELQNTITGIMQPKNSKPNKEIDRYSGLKKEFRQLDSFKKRTSSLDVLFNALITIRPTSTATERVFSTAGAIKTKKRTRLNLETFNSLVFLKYTFLKMK